MRSERESLAQRQYSDNGQDAIKLKSVQRENTQLQMRVKALVEEIEDLRAQKEHSSSQCDHSTHMYTKQLAEQSASLKAFEVIVLYHCLNSSCIYLYLLIDLNDTLFILLFK